MSQITTETMSFPFANFVDYEVVNIDNERELYILSVETRNGQTEYALHSFLLTRNILRWRSRRVLS
jgi:hypothetical protein